MLTPLRQTLSQHALAALILPTADPHLSEYIPEHWQSRQYFSGFTGSAGVLVVQPDSAQLWTDSRYWTQAEAELAGSGIVLQKQENGRNHIAHLAQTLPEHAAVGITPDMLSVAELRRIQAAFAPKNIALKHDLDYTAQAWGNARPALPTAPVFAQKAEFVPQSAAEKLHRVRQSMRENGADWHFISALDDIAWLTNLRGSDIAYNPVFLSHLLISANGTATLFVSPGKIPPEIQAALTAAAIQIQPYEHAADALAQLSGCLMYDPAKVAVSTVFRLPESLVKREQANPPPNSKPKNAPPKSPTSAKPCCKTASRCAAFSPSWNNASRKATPSPNTKLAKCCCTTAASASISYPRALARLRATTPTVRCHTIPPHPKAA